MLNEEGGWADEIPGGELQEIKRKKIQESPIRSDLTRKEQGACVSKCVFYSCIALHFALNRELNVWQY